MPRSSRETCPFDRTPRRAARSACDHPSDFRQSASFIAALGLENLNSESSGLFENSANDVEQRQDHHRLVERNWYLREWLEHFGKRQASLVNELGWDKSRANFVFHGKQPYRREIVNEIAAWLDIEPYELLMPPGEALALRSLREAARTIAQGDGATASAGRPHSILQEAAITTRAASPRRKVG